MPPILVLVICVITSALAWRKGYHPALWFFAAGIIGLIILAFLPYVNEKSPLSEDERAGKLKTGNTIGGVISAIGILFICAQMLG